MEHGLPEAQQDELAAIVGQADVFAVQGLGLEQRGHVPDVQRRIAHLQREVAEVERLIRVASGIAGTSIVP